MASDCHIGYFRDDPSEQPVFVAQSQLHRKDVQPWKLLILGSNLIQVIHNQIKEQIKKTKDEDDQKGTNSYFVNFKLQARTWYSL